MGDNNKENKEVEINYGSQSTLDIADTTPNNDDNKIVITDLSFSESGNKNGNYVQKEKRFGFSISIVTLQRHVKEYKEKQKAKIKYIVSMAIHVILLGYFCWATQYFLTHDFSLLSTTCTGYGFLMIVYIFIYFGVFYYIIIKPFLLPKAVKSLSGPYTKISSIKHIGPYIHSIILLGCIVFVIYDSWGNMSRIFPMVGLVSFLLFGFVFSANHRKVNWDIVISGLDLQFLFGILAIRWAIGRNIFLCIGDKATAFLSFANNGSSFVYGNDLVHNQSVFAFQALSTMLFVGLTVNILQHYGIMQKFIVSFGEFLKYFMGSTICESVNSAANIILGISETPMLIKSYLEHMTDSEIHSIMTSGFATVSGSVLAGYISFGANASDLITASVISAPAALCFSKIFYPETEKTNATRETIALSTTNFTSALDAASQGAGQGMQMIIGIIANVIAFIAFVAFISGILEWCGYLVGFTAESEIWAIYRIMGYVFMPISYLMGVPWSECYDVGRLIGIKTFVNEFVAFETMGTIELTERTKVIATYAICGFANPGSIGITISVLSSLAPSKKENIIRLVFRAWIGGAVVCFMTACIASMLMPDTVI